jgi:hypothetical protein
MARKPTNLPEEIEGVLYFGRHEPRIIGHLKVGKVHYSIAGVRRSDVRTDFTASRNESDGQADLFEGEAHEAKPE